MRIWTGWAILAYDLDTLAISVPGVYLSRGK